MSYADQVALSFWDEYDSEERWLLDIEAEQLPYDASPAPEGSTQDSGRNTGDSK